MCLIRDKISISHYIYDREPSVLTARCPGQEMGTINELHVLSAG